MPIVLNGTTGITSPDVDSLLNGLVYPDASSMGFRNRIINGDMRIDQRNAGASVTPTLDGQYTLDRWRSSLTQSSKFSVQQNAGSVTPPVGFQNYIGVTSLSAYSVLSGDLFAIQQNIEGFNVADLGWGTANASPITLVFWVRSSLTGVFGGALNNGNYNRSYPFTYTINAANTWEQKTVTVAGDTTGTWLKTNGIGLVLNLDLGSGSTLRGPSGTWAGAYYSSVTGATSIVGTNGATLYITGVQLEAGTVATPFERRDYGRELIMCQRYFETVGVFVSTSAWATIVNGAGPKVTKRASPTLTVTNIGSGSGAAFFYQAPFVGDPGAGWAYQTSGNSAFAAATLQMSIEL
jgi:hypothetical protein